MPACGGLSPYPRRMGGGRPRLEVILRAMLDARGSAYDTSWGTVVYAETMAIARAISTAWSTNARMANQADPYRLTSTLSRWEKILAMTPAPTDSDATRRARIVENFARVGRAAVQPLLEQRLQARLGSVFVSVEFLGRTVARSITNDASLASALGMTYVSSVPWSSTLATIIVRLQKPSGYTEGDFYTAAGGVAKALEGVVPAWVTWTWYRAPVSTPVAITDGPSAAGFYLDDAHNLDNNIFST